MKGGLRYIGGVVQSKVCSVRCWEFWGASLREAFCAFAFCRPLRNRVCACVCVFFAFSASRGNNNNNDTMLVQLEMTCNQETTAHVLNLNLDLESRARVCFIQVQNSKAGLSRLDLKNLPICRCSSNRRHKHSSNQDSQSEPCRDLHVCKITTSSTICRACRRQGGARFRLN